MIEFRRDSDWGSDSATTDKVETENEIDIEKYVESRIFICLYHISNRNQRNLKCWIFMTSIRYIDFETNCPVRLEFSIHFCDNCMNWTATRNLILWLDSKFSWMVMDIYCPEILLKSEEVRQPRSLSWLEGRGQLKFHGHRDDRVRRTWLL